MKKIKVNKNSFNSVEGLINECACTGCNCHCDPKDLNQVVEFGLYRNTYSKAYSFNISPE